MSYLTYDRSEIDKKATYKCGKSICESYKPVMMRRIQQSLHRTPGSVITVSSDSHYGHGDEAILARLAQEGDQTDLFMKFLAELRQNEVYSKSGNALWMVYVEGYSVDEYLKLVDRSKSTVLQWIRDGWILVADYCHAVVYKEKRIYNFTMKLPMFDMELEDYL